MFPSFFIKADSKSEFPSMLIPVLMFLKCPLKVQDPALGGALERDYGWVSTTSARGEIQHSSKPVKNFGLFGQGPLLLSILFCCLLELHDDVNEL